MLGELNELQRQAVLPIDGPVIVFAGAGSGKTRTLTHRIAYMIKEKSIAASNILAITFTNKAANEMKERLKGMLGYEATLSTISTFHSLCAKILRREIEILGYDRSFSIIDDDEQLKIISEVLSENNFDKKKARSIQNMIGYCKCFGTKSKDGWENKVWDLYEEKMKNLNLLDFDDLLLKVKEIFLYNPQILQKYRNKYRYILVDEFQDTNLIQYQIVKLLALEHRNLFVVGDDDQSIYSFRGANYENVRLFKKDFPEHLSFSLTQNYRSTQTILDGCNRLISHNKDREKKELFSNEKGNTNDVELFEARNEKEEVEYVLNEIYSLKNKNNSYEDFAILYRSSVLLRNFELGLIKQQIPYKVYGGVSYLKRREIKDVIAYLKLIVNNNDLHNFKRIVNVPPRGIGQASLEKIEDIKNTYKISLFEALDACKTIFPKSKYETLMEFKNMILDFSQKLEETELVQFYVDVLTKIDYLNYLKDEVDDFEDRKANLDEFKSILYQVDNGSENTSRTEKLREAFDEAILSDEYLQTQKENKTGVTISTIHSVKGLEFDYVFLVGFEENIFPNTFRLEDESELEEERRVAYVACTRARKKLIFTRAKQRMLYGSFFKNEPSRFLSEFMGNSMVKKKTVLFEDYQFDDIKPDIDVKPKEKSETVIQEANDPKMYKLGDQVVHKKFGEGVIIAIDGTIGQIFFNSEKRLIKIELSHPALNKK